ncbi:MAG: hypothetical protein ACK5RG_08030 [Cyclobacteriaceae bacterium]|jgi:hypothetical protein|nr:hypothetical protein [Flammeovirgaceae bacterium]
MKSSVWRVKTIVRISFLVAALTLISVYFWGLGQHRTFFENSMISITILAVVFFLFISIGLYRGINVVHETHDEKVSPTSNLNSIHTTSDLATSFDAPDIHIDGDDLGSILVSILLWIGWAILVAVAVWFFSEVILVAISSFAAMLYWIFFRALRLIFKNSNQCRGNIWESARNGAFYTVLYNFWIYGIFFFLEFLRH